jgi:Zn finger protein HypA/HybF involved in hydrogenase expression
MTSPFEMSFDLKKSLKCWCHKCFKEQTGFSNHLWMILCPTCGNKRCPKATDHNLDCIGSNEPGQDGSIYD